MTVSLRQFMLQQREPVETALCQMLPRSRQVHAAQMNEALEYALFPGGNPDHEVSGADFIAEAIRLLAAFHPCNLKLPEEAAPSDSQDLEF